jgi:hypothetical protein
VSSNVNLVFDHRLDASDVAALPQRLDPAAFPELAQELKRLAAFSNNTEIIGKVVAPWRSYTFREASRMSPAEAWAQERIPFLSHPTDVRLGLTSHVGVLDVGWKWGIFLKDATVWAATQDFFSVLVPVLGATAVLYVEGEGCSSRALDGFFEGLDFAAIVRRLREQCRPPAASLDELVQLFDQGDSLGIYCLDRLVAQ